MAVVSLSIPPGVVRGATPGSTPGRWYDASLVRWQGGGLTPVGGWDRVTSSPLASSPRKILPWVDNDGTRRAAIACNSHLYIETSGEYFNATPTTFTTGDVSLATGGYGSNVFGAQDYGDEREDTIDVNALPFTYSLAHWGEEMLAVFSSDGKLLKWNPQAPTTKAAAISGAPTVLRAAVVTPERHVLAIGGSDTPRRIQWCSREDYTDWNFSSTTNTAGFLDVETGGPLTHLVVVREGVLVFSESDVFLVRYVGLPFVYGAEKIASMSSPVSPQAVAVFDGRAAWMGREGFWLYDGGAVRPIPCTVGDFVYQTLNRPFARFNAAASSNGLFPEAWFFYPSAASEDGENDRYLIWNYAENWWSLGAVARSCMCDAGVYRYPLAATADGTVYQHESGYLDAGLPRTGTVWAESSSISIGDGERVYSVKQGQPDSLRGAAATRMTFFTQFTREGSETAFGPYTARADGYMDMRFQARDARLRVEATRDEDWTIGALRLTVEPRGRR
jgi:hypothetical protein